MDLISGFMGQLFFLTHVVFNQYSSFDILTTLFVFSLFFHSHRHCCWFWKV